MITRRAGFLADYQNVAYSERYRATLARFQTALPEDTPEPLMQAAARGLFKLMAYKDEYEVARLLTDSSFAEGLKTRFDGDFTIRYHLAPPLLSRARDAQGRPRKRSYGKWMGQAMRALAAMKGLRGSRFNLFGYHSEARLHRDLLAWYEAGLPKAAALCAQGRTEDCLTFLSAPDDIRGYGPIRTASAEKARAAADAALDL